jgi:hypothetical protein
MMKRVLDQRFAVLLAALLLDLLLSPFIEGSTLGRILFNVLTTVVLISALYTVSAGTRISRLAVALWAVAMAGVWLDYLTPSFSMMKHAPVLTTFFIAYTAYRILMYVLRQEKVSSETIYAALSVYLMIGLVWAMLHFGLESVQPGSYNGLNKVGGYAGGLGSACNYYSFVTLTTLGYGDVTPITPAARSLSYVEALMGQLFLAVLIARLVGLHIAHSMKEK